jgi:ABC-type branched-subunit amino acid transport system substrate-binding protein
MRPQWLRRREWLRHNQRSNQRSNVPEHQQPPAIAISLSAGLIVCIGAVQADEPITIGGALCLTGIQAPLDAPGLKGAELAVKAINEKGRRPRSSAQVR